jgi:ankyrin repeat protein
VESRIVDIVKYLLRVGADPTHVCSHSGHTPFHEACKAGYLPVVKVLAEYQHDTDCVHGIDLWTVNNAGWGCFHWGVYSGSQKVVSWLLQSSQRKRILNGSNSDDEEMDHEKIVSMNKTRIKKEDLEYEDSEDEDYEEFMWTVVDLVRGVTNNGLSPLHIAAQTDSVPMLLLLLSKGAHIHCRSRTGDTALHIAAANGSLPSTICLLEKGSLLPRSLQLITNRLGQTSLMKAVMNNHHAVAIYLLEHSRDSSPTFQTKKDHPAALINVETTMLWTTFSLAVRAATAYVPEHARDR